MLPATAPGRGVIHGRVGGGLARAERRAGPATTTRRGQADLKGTAESGAVSGWSFKGRPTPQSRRKRPLPFSAARAGRFCRPGAQSRCGIGTLLRGRPGRPRQADTGADQWAGQGAERDVAVKKAARGASGGASQVLAGIAEQGGGKRKPAGLGKGSFSFPGPTLSRPFPTLSRRILRESPICLWEGFGRRGQNQCSYSPRAPQSLQRLWVVVDTGRRENQQADATRVLDVPARQVKATDPRNQTEHMRRQQRREHTDVHRACRMRPGQTECRACRGRGTPAPCCAIT